jgi:hypothetical protein
MRTRFADSLNRQLLDYYGRIPSAAALARDFNLRAENIAPITQEAARRWIRGLSMPEMDKLQVLISWLGLNIDFLSESSHEGTKSSSHLQSGDKSSQEVMRLTRSLNAVEIRLIQSFRETDLRGKQILLTLADSLNTEIKSN